MYSIVSITWHGSTIEVDLHPKILTKHHYHNSKLEIIFGKLFIHEDYLQTESAKFWIDKYIENGHEKLLKILEENMTAEDLELYKLLGLSDEEISKTNNEYYESIELYKFIIGVRI